MNDKKKDYLRLFANYCRRHQIWFAVCTNGELDQVTFFFDNQRTDVTSEAPLGTRFGKKSGYDWLVAERRSVLKDINNGR